MVAELCASRHVLGFLVGSAFRGQRAESLDLSCLCFLGTFGEV